MDKRKKINGLLIFLITYIFAFGVGLLSYYLFDSYNLDELMSIFLADTVATIFVFIVGIFLKTASMYDPYWSVQTVFIYIPLMIKYQAYNFGSFLFLAAIMFWSVRLTINFIKGFDNISYIDWRYKMLKEKTGPFYQAVNLLGIHMVPTVVVFFASVPAFLYVINGCVFEPLNLIGIFTMIMSTVIELVSDNDMRRFKAIRSSNKEIINIGLWKHSRHPNYFGEIMFWYGVAFTFVFSNINLFYALLGAVLNTLLFIFISVPMEENHLKNYKEGYEEYKKRTNVFLPINIFNK
ncbi:DUF1295 domain-containing protein [bacterium]|nr:DUF1295 domain-containing protein [bacterium]